MALTPATLSLDTQEFMIRPVGALLRRGLRQCAGGVSQAGQLLKAEGYATSVGDEGGYAPNPER